MGSKLSTAQKGVCYHIVGILVSANVKFSKGKLTQFIRWHFLHFPQTSPEEVHNIQFWDKIGHEFPVNSLGHWSNQHPLKKQFDEFRNGTGGKLQALPGGQQQPKKLKGERRPARRADTKRAGQGNKGTKTNQARGNVTVSVSEADASKTTSAGPQLKVKQNNVCFDLGEPMLTMSSVNEPYRLQLTESLHLKDTDWHFVSVNPEQKGTWHRIRCKYIVIGDTKHTPHEIEIAPGMTTPDPEQFVLGLHCFHPPLFLPKGQIVAEAIPVPFLPEGTEKQGPTVAQVQVIGKDKPNLWGNVNGGGESKRIEMLVDTGADCTVIPVQDWPAHWPLQNVAGHVQGVGGLQLARQPKSIIQIEGPNGQLANICPFVLDYWEPLLGRDLMAQWSVTINIPDSPQHFCTVAIEQQSPTQKLKWKTDKPVEVKQWPLSKQKIKALEELVEEQLKKGHIVETTCQNAKLCPVSKSTSKLN